MVGILPMTLVVRELELEHIDVRRERGVGRPNSMYVQPTNESDHRGEEANNAVPKGKASRFVQNIDDGETLHE